MPNTTEKAKPIGGLYTKTSKKGLDYLNGYVTVGNQKMNIVVFKNQKKFNETTPDYAIFISEPPAQNQKEVATAVTDTDDSIFS
jgi:MinD superfamily P-loop ATPase